VARKRMSFIFLFLMAYPGGATAFQHEPAELAVTINGRAHRLEALIVKPDGAGPFPLAVISHGSPRKAEDRAKASPNGLSRQAEEFAAHGYLAAVVMRRSYGRSSGEWAESYDGCKFGAYEQGGNGSADDIAAAIGVLSARPDVDAATIVAIGQSAGGFGSLAYAARNPKGLKAVINFAGGRGSQGKWDVCQERRLLDAFEVFGKTAKVPSLWVYAENDNYFGPDLAQEMLARYAKAGAPVIFFKAPPFGDDGHRLFSRVSGIAIWRDQVQNFLHASALPVAAALPTLDAPNLPPPSMLGNRGREHWQRYLLEPDHRAFAASSDNHFGWRSGQRTVEDARTGALKNCKGKCKILNIDGKPSE